MPHPGYVPGLPLRETNLLDEADEIGAVLPSDQRLTATLNALTTVVVDLSAAKRTTPRVQFVGVQLGSETLDEHVHSVNHQRRLQLTTCTW